MFKYAVLFPTLMEEEKFSIQNENSFVIQGSILRPKKTGKYPTVVFSYDLLDAADTQYLKELSKLYLDAGHAVIKFDPTNSFGKSDGRPENVTVLQRSKDLKLVIEYAKRRSYVSENKLLIIGFGFGGMAALQLEGFDALAKALILVNTPSQIDDTAWTRFNDRDLMRVKLKRYFHVLRDGKEVRINYFFLEDGYRLDMFRCARNLRTPVLYLVSADDTIVSRANSERLFERTNSKKEFDVVQGWNHDLGKKQVQQLFEKASLFLKKQR